MGIEKITSQISSAIKGVGEKGKAKITEVVVPAVKSVKNGKNKLAGSLEALANNAKASILEAGDKKITNTAHKNRVNALVSEGLASGLTKKQAVNGAKELVNVTGVFAAKDAQKSAELLKDVPLPQSIRKQELMAKFADKLQK